MNWLKRLALLLLPWLMLVGCAGIAHPTVLLSGCEIPAQLDYVASGPAEIPESQPLPPKDALKIWSGDRHIIASRADDYNALVNHVKGKCQK